MAKKASTTQLVHIRMPKAFHGKLMRDADRSGQTLNAEILRRLQESYESDDTLKEVSDALDGVRGAMEESRGAMKEALTIIRGRMEADKILASEPSDADLQGLREHSDKVREFLNKHSTAKSKGNAND